MPMSAGLALRLTSAVSMLLVAAASARGRGAMAVGTAAAPVAPTSRTYRPDDAAVGAGERGEAAGGADAGATGPGARPAPHIVFVFALGGTHAGDPGKGPHLRS